jgi:hypothetical protein
VRSRRRRHGRKEKKFRCVVSRARSRGPPHLCPRTAMPLGSVKDRAVAAGCWLRLCSGWVMGERSRLCLACLFLVHCATMRALSSFFPLCVVTGPQADRGRVRCEEHGVATQQWRTGVWMLENLRHQRDHNREIAVLANQHRDRWCVSSAPRGAHEPPRGYDRARWQRTRYQMQYPSPSSPSSVGCIVHPREQKHLSKYTRPCP